MKSKIVLILILGFTFFSCTNDYNLSVSVDRIELSLTGEEVEFTISSDVNWAIQVDSWVSVSQTYGKGDAVITIKAGGNYTGAERTTELRVSSGVEMIETIIITQKSVDFFLDTNELVFDVAGTPQQVKVTANSEWKIAIPEDAEWCVPDILSGSGDAVVTFTPTPYTENVLRSKRSIEFSISDFKTELVVSQQSDKVYLDGAYFEYQTFTATDVTKPVNLVIMGDGFIDEDYMPGGVFDVAVDKAVNAFFSVEPYPTYEEYFNVYKVVAYSQERGATVEENFADGSVRKQTRNTVFSSVLEGGTSTGISCNPDAVYDYVLKIPDFTEDDFDDITVIVMINLDVYAGTAFMWGTGKGLALCPVGEEFTRIVYHEAGGHAFAKLYDEYIYYPEEPYPSIKADELEYYREVAGSVWNFGANLSLTDNLDEVHWKHYFDKTGYEVVGMCEGADTYGKGIWRPEEKSCMGDSDMPAYFNAPSREAIVRRIMTLNGKGFDYADFYAKDKTSYPINTRANAIKKRPLAPPVLMDR